MDLLPASLWMGLLVWLSSHTETEASDTDVCQDFDVYDLSVHSSSSEGVQVESAALTDGENFLCLLYPTKLLNCSWSFLALKQDAQLSVFVSICSDGATIHSLNHSSEDRVGSASLTLSEHKMTEVILQFNITLHDKWTVYSYTYDVGSLEVLPPPRDVSASIKDGALLVTWSKPINMEDSGPHCFEYQLDMGDQERPTHLETRLSYKEPHADPSRTYNVRMRTRMTDSCMERSHWSDWSHTVTVERTDKLNILIIISISLGLPMILLALLLLVRHQSSTFDVYKLWVYEVLFPPIPSPPQKYIGFLEKTETFTFLHPSLSAELVEEVTEVEDTRDVLRV